MNISELKGNDTNEQRVIIEKIKTIINTNLQRGMDTIKLR